MTAAERTLITVSATVNAPVEKVWDLWTKPEHVVNWNSASPDWHTPKAENDLREGGRFSYRMEARDGSFGFDFDGGYTKVIPNEVIEYKMEDGRNVVIQFATENNATKIIESFEAEGTHSDEMQRAGWQAIMDNFKQYTETAVSGATV